MLQTMTVHSGHASDGGDTWSFGKKLVSIVMKYATRCKESVVNVVINLHTMNGTPNTNLS